jgi:hypothetical protein
VIRSKKLPRSPWAHSKMLELISWNINGRLNPWNELLDSDLDVALLQEARKPRSPVATLVEAGPTPWQTSWNSRPWRTAVVRLSDQAKVEWLESEPIEVAANGRFVHSLPGTLAAARITPTEGEPILAISMYAPWEKTYRNKRWMYADASAHRLISDIQVFLGGDNPSRILAAGDLNILYGYEEGGRSPSPRYQSVFDRMEAIGLAYLGPQFPNGRQADPWPGELPKGSLNVPAFHHSRQPRRWPPVNWTLSLRRRNWRIL